MYFVTFKRQGYTLFSTTPSERFAVGITEEHRVQLLVRAASGDWQLLREWAASDYSQTDLMASLHRCAEPASAEEFVRLLPPAIAAPPP